MSFTLKEILANPGNIGGPRDAGKIKYLVIHYTGNDGDRAANNAAYYHDSIVKASAHYFVDDHEVYCSVPDLTIAWAVGGKKWADCEKTGGGKLYGAVTNSNSISIELCDTRGDGVYGASEETLENAAELARMLMEKYSIPLENVVRHFDVTGKHCPAYMMDEAAWQAFKDRLASPSLDNTPSPAHKEGVRWCVEQGILTGNQQGDLMLSQPITRQQFCTMLYRYANRKGIQ